MNDIASLIGFTVWNVTVVVIVMGVGWGSQSATVLLPHIREVSGLMSDLVVAVFFGSCCR
jgi:hypothetical protein